MGQPELKLITHLNGGSSILELNFKGHFILIFTMAHISYSGRRGQFKYSLTCDIYSVKKVKVSEKLRET